MEKYYSKLNNWPNILFTAIRAHATKLIQQGRKTVDMYNMNVLFQWSCPHDIIYDWLLRMRCFIDLNNFIVVQLLLFP